MTSSVLDRASEVIQGAERLALACHVHPDGDALGSMLAMHHLATRSGKPTVFSWGEPFTIAPHYAFLPGLGDATKPDDFPRRPDAMIVFDCPSLDRLGSLAESARRARELIVLDHHDDCECFGSVNVVESGAAATAVLVRRLAGRLGWRLTREAALCLYVGLLTDTGRFQYSNTTDQVFHLAEELSRFDLPIADVTRELYEKHRFAYVRLLATSLARAELDRDRRFVATWVTADDLATHGVTFEETEGLIDIVRRTAEADVSCVAKEAPGEGLRVSLRSVSDVDVGAIATALGGGGHAYMAGFATDLPVAEAIARVKALLPG